MAKIVGAGALIMLTATPALADGDGDRVDLNRLGELARDMVTGGTAIPIGSNDGLVMGRTPARFPSVKIEGRTLTEAHFVAARVEPRSDGGVSSRSIWLFDCETRVLAIRQLNANAAQMGAGAVVETYDWDEAEVLRNLDPPGAHTLGRKMVDAVCRPDRP